MGIPAATITETGSPLYVNRANANDGDDGTFASWTGGVSGDSSLSNTLIFKDFSAILGTTPQNLRIRFLHSGSLSVAGAGDAGFVRLSYSTNAGGAYTTVVSHFSSGSFNDIHEVDLIGVNPAQLWLRVECSVTNTAPGSASVAHNLYAMEVSGGDAAPASMMGFM